MASLFESRKALSSLRTSGLVILPAVTSEILGVNDAENTLLACGYGYNFKANGKIINNLCLYSEGFTVARDRRFRLMTNVDGRTNQFLQLVIPKVPVAQYKLVDGQMLPDGVDKAYSGDPNVKPQVVITHPVTFIDELSIQANIKLSLSTPKLSGLTRILTALGALTYNHHNSTPEAVAYYTNASSSYVITPAVVAAHLARKKSDKSYSDLVESLKKYNYYVPAQTDANIIAQLGGGLSYAFGSSAVDFFLDALSAFSGGKDAGLANKVKSDSGREIVAEQLAKSNNLVNAVLNAKLSYIPDDPSLHAALFIFYSYLYGKVTNHDMTDVKKLNVDDLFMVATVTSSYLKKNKPQLFAFIMWSSVYQITRIVNVFS